MQTTTVVEYVDHICTVMCRPHLSVYSCETFIFIIGSCAIEAACKKKGVTSTFGGEKKIKETNLDFSTFRGKKMKEKI